MLVRCLFLLSIFHRFVSFTLLSYVHWFRCWLDVEEKTNSFPLSLSGLQHTTAASYNWTLTNQTKPNSTWHLKFRQKKTKKKTNTFSSLHSTLALCRWTVSSVRSPRDSVLFHNRIGWLSFFGERLSWKLGGPIQISGFLGKSSSKVSRVDFPSCPGFNSAMPTLNIQSLG